MEAKPVILSRKTIKPSSPTPPHLKYYQRSFLDQLSVNTYVPVIMFYSASDVTSHSTSISSLSEKLKSSLSDVLTLYYPLCGRLKGNDIIECNDAGVLYTEAKVPISLNEILQNPQNKVLQQFLPFDQYEPGKECYINNEEEPVMLGVQVNELNCGALAIGLTISHAIVDGITFASFLKAWVSIANGNIDKVTKPIMDAYKVFPPTKFKFSIPLKRGDEETIVGTRLVFDEESLCRLKAEFHGFNPTRVEALTALIWKSFMEMAKSSVSDDEQKVVGSFISLAVNIRRYLEPPLPEHCIGNIHHGAITSIVDLKLAQEIPLKDLALMIKDAIRRVVDNDVKELVDGEGGFDMAVNTIKNIMSLLSMGNKWFVFTSWTGFNLYEADFGWGKPTWVCTFNTTIKNTVIFLPSKSGKGIEAMITLTGEDTEKFECLPEILQYARVSRL
ncbi:hypothetical protein RJT34_15833 [Clitoria ternatea]|uniref:Uncharacterized protein n=1 Tax=Clitoria ternatea TaxID=43366 RepID=A0AAN9J956_CLITE